VHFVRRRTDSSRGRYSQANNVAQTKKGITAIKRAGQTITASKSAARKFLFENGFITKTGKIAKRYR
jgi:hypothetical protein